MANMTIQGQFNVLTFFFQYFPALTAVVYNVASIRIFPREKSPARRLFCLLFLGDEKICLRKAKHAPECETVAAAAGVVVVAVEKGKKAFDEPV